MEKLLVIIRYNKHGSIEVITRDKMGTTGKIIYKDYYRAYSTAKSIKKEFNGCLIDVITKTIMSE